MVVVPLSQSTEFSSPKFERFQSDADEPVATGRAEKGNGINWARVAAVGSLALSGVLLMSGRRRAGLVAAVSGTALAMLDQQESMKAWWETLPVYLDEVQLMLKRAQGAVEDVAIQRDRLQRILRK
jgi:hypothetical protein